MTRAGKIPLESTFRRPSTPSIVTFCGPCSRGTVCPQDDFSNPPVPRWHAGACVFVRTMVSTGSVQSEARAPPRVRTLATAVQYLLRGGDHGRQRLGQTRASRSTRCISTWTYRRGRGRMHKKRPRRRWGKRGVLYAHDAGILSRSESGLTKIVCDKLWNCARRWG